MIKSKYRGPLVLLISLMFLTLIPYTAGATTYTCDFDDGILGTQYDNGIFNTYNLTTGCYIDDTFVHSGTRSYFFDDDDAGRIAKFFINFTTLTEIYNISFWLKRSGTDSDTTYIDFNNETNVSIMRLMSTNDGTGKHYWSYQEWDDTWNRIGSSTENIEWCNFIVQVNATDTAYYYFKTWEEGSTRTIVTDLDDAQIKYIYISNPSSTKSFFLDDIVLTSGLTGDGDGDVLTGCDDNSVGSVFGGVSSVIEGDTTYRFLVTSYNIETTGTIDSFSLGLLSTMGEQYGGGSYLSLKINDYIHGPPSSVYQIGTSNIYIAEWTGLDHEINNEEIYIGILQQGFTNPQWNVFSSTSELQGDGQKWHYFYTESQGSTWWEGYDYTSLPTPNAYGRHDGEDLQYLMCIDIEPPDIQEFTNSVFAVPSTCKVYEQIDITWLINSTSILYGYQTIVNVITPSGNVPYYVTMQDGHVFYTPTEEGNFGVNLTINGINVSYDTFTVSGTLIDYVYTEPNPSDTGQTFTVFYNYTSVHDGIIYIYDNEFEEITSWEIEPQTTGQKDVTLQNSGLYYILVKALPTNYSKYTVANNIHYVGGSLSPAIAVNPDECEVGFTVEITGQHSHLGQNVKVLVGNTVVSGVGDADHFNLEYETEIKGIFTVSLILYIEGEIIILANTSLQVYGPDVVSEGDATTRLYIGIAIVLFFSFAGVGVMVGMKQETAIFIPMFFGLIGAIISVLFDLLPMWVLFVLGIFIIGFIVYHIMPSGKK